MSDKTLDMHRPIVSQMEELGVAALYKRRVDAGLHLDLTKMRARNRDKAKNMRQRCSKGSALVSGGGRALA
ncbi:hypothetical protein BH11PSE8_BH11PSE8_12680 [soil metagenome]